MVGKHGGKTPTGRLQSGSGEVGLDQDGGSGSKETLMNSGCNFGEKKKSIELATR